MDSFPQFQKHLAEGNLERLSEYEPPELPPWFADKPSPCSLGLTLLTKWSKDNSDSIKKAIENQVFGQGSNQIDWNIAFLPFMESCAVYLRDWGSMVKAWKAYRDYKWSNDQTKHDEALEAYKDAHKDIEALAAVWGLKYVPICDLVTEPPISNPDNPDWDGPFCAAFCTTEAQKDTPFIGIAFKGTNPGEPREVNVDYNYDLEASTFLGGQLVSKGVYGGLFGQFKGTGNDPAYTYIMKKVAQLTMSLPNSRKDTSIPVHVTGHSLGGSYSSFCFAQAVLDKTNGNLPKPNFIQTGDEYTFGAPRVGSNAWAKWCGNLSQNQKGMIWRIVNEGDIVPQVPATTLKPEQVDFHHIDNGMQISPKSAPIPIETEVDKPNPKPYDVKSMEDLIQAILRMGKHIPNFYYDAMMKAMGKSK